MCSIQKLITHVRNIGILMKDNGLHTPSALYNFVVLKKKIGIDYLEFKIYNYYELWEEQKESLLFMEEYYKYCFKVNPFDSLKVLRDKRTVIQRFPHLLGRECLILEYQPKANFVEFAMKHSSFYAKKNYNAAGIGTRVFRNIITSEDRERAYKICRKEGLDIIEEFIPQHSVLSSIFPHVVNTIRIHTLRTKEGIKVVLKPVLAVPSGAERNSVHTKEDFYAAWIDLETGRLLENAFCSRKKEKKLEWNVKKHSDTGAVFGDIQIPYWEELKKMVIEAAEEIPELSFIGWDIAISPEKPVIIEGNAISGSVRFYQLMNFVSNGGYGVKKEYADMFAMADAGNE